MARNETHEEKRQGTARLSHPNASKQLPSSLRYGDQDAVRLAEALVRGGAISKPQMASVLARHRSGIDKSLDLSDVLLKLGCVDAEILAKVYASECGLGYAESAAFGHDSTIAGDVLAIVPADAAWKYDVVPIGLSPDGTSIRVAATKWRPESYDACRQFAERAKLQLTPLIGSAPLVRSAVSRYYSSNKSNSDMSNERPNDRSNKIISAVPAVVDPRKSALPRAIPSAVDRRASDVLSGAANPAITFAGQTATRSADENVDISDFTMDQPAIIQMVHKLIADAIHHRASDIHFEPMRDGLTVKYRIDGTLCDWDKVPKGFANACTSRLKVMADMNIAERRVPQDGRITVKTGGRTVDMRVSSLPTQYGEAIVLRILDRTAMRLNIDHLGFGDRNLKTLHNVIKRPHGIFLATGPTGSGKTTTLYAAIHAIQSPDINIITVEDPIEYELEGIRQSNTNEKAGLTFAKQLRAILRQDPDVIYVGEIRDSETAEIGFRAALTGHLVFSTLHCNEAAAAVTRLLNMGMDPFLIASSVIGVLAQRLVRKVCSNCAQPYRPTIEEMGLLGLDPNSREVREATFRMGAGCDACNGSGYAGRCSVQELLVMDEYIRAVTLERSTATKIRQVATTMGSNPMIPMRRDAAMKVMQGITTCAEVQKRVMLDDD